MSRHLSILHRKPRTRRERMRIRLRHAHERLSNRLTQLRAGRRNRTSHHRMQEAWQHLAHDASAGRGAHRGRAHAHLRHRHR